VLLIPYADLLMAVVRRMRAGMSVFAADKKHLQHRLLAIGHSHRASVLVMYLWASLFAGSVVWLSILRTSLYLLVIVTVVALLALLMVSMPRLRFWNRGAAVPLAAARPAAVTRGRAASGPAARSAGRGPGRRSPGLHPATAGPGGAGQGVTSAGAGVTAADPGLRGPGPGVAASGPTAGGPGVTGPGPGVAAGGPGVTGPGPGVTGPGPGVTGSGPGMAAAGPGVMGHGPGVTADGPGVMGHGPGVTAGGSGVTAAPAVAGPAAGGPPWDDAPEPVLPTGPSGRAAGPGGAVPGPVPRGPAMDRNGAAAGGAADAEWPMPPKRSRPAAADPARPVPVLRGPDSPPSALGS
jgi:hypothetical protein